MRLNFPHTFLPVTSRSYFLKINNKARIVQEGGGVTFWARDYRYRRDTRLMVLWGKCTYHLFVTLEERKTVQVQPRPQHLVLLGKMCKNCSKQSDSVANSNVQGTGRFMGSSGETSTDPRPNITYVQGTKEKIQGLHVHSSLPSQSGRNIGYLGKNSIRITWRKKMQISFKISLRKLSGFTFNNLKWNGENIHITKIFNIHIFYLRIPSYYWFHIFFCSASSAAPAEERRQRPSAIKAETDAQTQKSIWNIPFSIEGNWEQGCLVSPGSNCGQTPWSASFVSLHGY